MSDSQGLKISFSDNIQINGKVFEYELHELWEIRGNHRLRGLVIDENEQWVVILIDDQVYIVGELTGYTTYSSYGEEREFAYSCISGLMQIVKDKDVLLDTIFNNSPSKAYMFNNEPVFIQVSSPHLTDYYKEDDFIEFFIPESQCSFLRLGNYWEICEFLWDITDSMSTFMLGVNEPELKRLAKTVGGIL